VSRPSTLRHQSYPQPQRLQRTNSLLKYVQDVGQVTAATWLGIAMISSSVVAGGLVGLAISFRNLPDVRILRNYVPTETSYIYDINGKLLYSLHDEANREVVDINRISPHLKRAVLAIEDSYFYSHNGINPSSLGRALLANFAAGSTVEGGSTITMQLVKNLFLTPRRAFSRKLAEAVLALRLEQIFSKDEILEMYLNQVYWGHNNYGAETAAQTYFNKSARDLTLPEAAMMAGLIQAPEDYSPFNHYQYTKERQLTVLNRMRQLGWITAQEEATAKAAPLVLGEVKSFRSSVLPYVTEAAVKEVKQRFGSEAVLKGECEYKPPLIWVFSGLLKKSCRLTMPASPPWLTRWPWWRSILAPILLRLWWAGLTTSKVSIIGCCKPIVNPVRPLNPLFTTPPLPPVALPRPV
jgi:penicillin-binding protein 1A